MYNSIRTLLYASIPANTLNRRKALKTYLKKAELIGFADALTAHVLDGKDLPREPSDLPELIAQTRATLAEYRVEHARLVAALSEKGGVLHEKDIAQIWNTEEGEELCHLT